MKLLNLLLIGTFSVIFTGCNNREESTKVVSTVFEGYEGAPAAQIKDGFLENILSFQKVSEDKFNQTYPKD